MDTMLPIWRMGEALLHAERLATLLRKSDSSAITVRFRAIYWGLSGRVLRAWSNPLSDLLIEGHAARGDEAMLETVLHAEDISERMAAHLFPLVTSLYERFGGAGLNQSRIAAEVDRLLQSRVS